jgi:hypothetical protein
MLEPNPHLTLASSATRAGGPDWKTKASKYLDEALATAWGRGALRAAESLPEAQRLLQSANADDETRVRAVRALESLNTFSHLVNRTRRRDIGEFTTRKPKTYEVDFSTAQQSVYDQLMDLSRRIIQRTTPGRSTEFLLSTLHRQAASCLNGLSPMLEDIMLRRLTEEEISEADGDIDNIDVDLLREFAADIAQLRKDADRLGDEDKKFDVLQAIVAEKLTMPNNKLLVFSTFRHTLKYIARRIGPNVRLGLIHGGRPEIDRRIELKRFALPKEHDEAVDVLLCSEVGTEGLDYQFCDALVNYDLPWNPMRVEQRIGRIDRRGQKSETIAIKNLVVRGTIDFAIYDRCLSRIGIFTNALGAGEEILGSLTREIRSIAQDLTLDDEERDNRLQQLADNKLGRIQELAALEDKQAEFFGLDVNDQGVASAMSIWLSADKIALMVGRYLRRLDPGRQIRLTPGAVLRPSRELREKLLGDLPTSARSTQVDQAWERWLRSAEPTRQLTVDAGLTADRETEILNPAHPLVRAAARDAQLSEAPFVRLHVVSAELAPGWYPFAVRGWTRLGVRDDFTVRVIALDVEHQNTVERLLADAGSKGDPTTAGHVEDPRLQARAYEAWSYEKSAHLTATAASARARRASLGTTHGARRAQLAERRERASDERIIRMLEGQLNNLEAEYQLRMKQLDEDEKRCDLLDRPLASGVLEVGAP